MTTNQNNAQNAELPAFQQCERERDACERAEIVAALDAKEACVEARFAALEADLTKALEEIDLLKNRIERLEDFRDCVEPGAMIIGGESGNPPGFIMAGVPKDEPEDATVSQMRLAQRLIAVAESEKQ